jgi:hypothetical protein
MKIRRLLALFLPLGLCLASAAAASQGAPSASAAADAEASRLEAAAAAMRQRAAALKQLEDANRALAATQMPVPSDPVLLPMAPAPSAAPAQPITTTAKAQAEAVADAVAEVQEQRATQKFGGVEFGVGVSFTLDVGKTDRVSEAEVVNGIVRVTDEDNGRARIMLELHHFFTPDGNIFGRVNDVYDAHGVRRDIKDQQKEWGIGPFVAIQPGTDDIIEAVAAGLMIGFRYDSTLSQSFNLGIGWVVDPNTRVLGEGIVANEALPAGETGIRYKEEMQNGLLILASFGF